MPKKNQKSNHTKKILVVDDEPEILDAMEILLQKMGYDVQTTNRGKTALALLETEKFDLVLIDIIMPEMSGTTLAKKIRAEKKLKHLKIAFLTVVTLGKAGRKVIQQLKPVDYFEKPIDVPDFRIRIKKIFS